MDRLHAALAELRKDLDDLQIDWSLIGGLAVSARAEPRTTRDIDVCVAVGTDHEAENLVRDLVSRGYRICEPGLIEQEVLDRTPRSGSTVQSAGLTWALSST